MNLNSSILFTKLSLPYMIKNKWGRIINVSSLSAYNYKSRPWYTIAKKSQIDFVKAYPREKNMFKMELLLILCLPEVF